MNYSMQLINSVVANNTKKAFKKPMKWKKAKIEAI